MCFFSITLFLGLREVLQDLFLESALVYFLSNTKFLKTLFIQLSKVQKLEIKDTVLHRSFDGTGELNKGSSLIILVLIHWILETALSSWTCGDFEAQAGRSGGIFIQWQLGHRQKSFLQAGLSCKPVAIRLQLMSIFESSKLPLTISLFPSNRSNSDFPLFSECETSKLHFAAYMLSI